MLQNLTTNIAESYHRDSKINLSSGLKGLVFRVKENAAVYKRRQETATQEFRTKTVSTVKEYEEIKHFPFPVQKKIQEQYAKARDKHNAGKPPKRYLHTACCDCEFFRAYNLPCSHIFHCDIMYRKERECTANQKPTRIVEAYASAWKFDD